MSAYLAMGRAWSCPRSTWSPRPAGAPPTSSKPAVARGLIEAFHQIEPSVPFVVRLDGTNDEEGRRLLAEANLPNVHTEATMLGAAEKVVELASEAVTTAA